MLALHIAPEAIRDLDEASAYIAEYNIAKASRFLDAASESFNLLRGMPGVGIRYGFLAPALRDVQRWQVKGFTVYQIFYKVDAERVTIVRVLHGNRDIRSIMESP